MCGQSYPIGVPMDEEMMMAMRPEEELFWVDFLNSAGAVINRMEAEGKTPPFDPPASLSEKYRTAVEKYDGRIYCQVRQLEAIFNFNGGGKDSGHDLQTFLRGTV